MPPFESLCSIQFCFSVWLFLSLGHFSGQSGLISSVWQLLPTTLREQIRKTIVSAIAPHAPHLIPEPNDPVAAENIICNLLDCLVALAFGGERAQSAFHNLIQALSPPYVDLLVSFSIFVLSSCISLKRLFVVQTF